MNPTPKGIITGAAEMAAPSFWAYMDSHDFLHPFFFCIQLLKRHFGLIWTFMKFRAMIFAENNGAKFYEMLYKPNIQEASKSHKEFI